MLINGFKIGYEILYSTFLDKNIDEEIAVYFNKSRRLPRLKNNSFLEKKKKKEGGNLIYFKDRDFMYTVRDKLIQTITLTKKAKKRLNKTIRPKSPEIMICDFKNSPLDIDGTKTDDIINAIKESREKYVNSLSFEDRIY